MYESGYGDSFGGYTLLFWVAIYLYFVYAQYRIAVKIGHQYTWWAFIPIVNVFQVTQMAKKPWWWFVLCLIPVVNIVALALLWIEVAKVCNKSPLLGFLMIIPIVNFIVIGILGFSGPTPVVPEPSPTPTRQPEKVA
ncbi:MAG: hypothetical protein JSV44_11175 [Candidatus Zixiibacteriota bacterium]|nr:MAG: hypothetical protein JSV44_11175 [candidate division Zixibacteria bacterium]